MYFPFICEGSANEFQCTDQKPPHIDILSPAKLINVSNQCIFFQIRSSRDLTFCAIFVCGPLQFKLKRQFISPRIGRFRESGFDSKNKRHQFVAREGCTCMLWMFCRAGNIEGREKTKSDQRLKKFYYFE